MATERLEEACLDALGSPVRRQIMRILQAGPRYVAEIASELPVSRPAVSKHLKVLEQAALVRHTPAGNRNLYWLEQEGFAAARGWLDSFWRDAYARLSLVAENAESGPGKPH